MKRQFAKMLQDELLKRGWSQSDLAHRASLGRDAISTYVNARSFPEPKSMKAIAGALGKTMEEMYPKTGSDPSSAHAITIRQDDTDPTRVFLSINRSIPIRVAGQIVEMVGSEIDE